ncbi:unnamed protein product, partial [marine sediment metagenome]
MNGRLTPFQRSIRSLNAGPNKTWTEYIIMFHGGVGRGYGVWVAEKGWRDCNALMYFKNRQQAEEFESE